MFSGLLGMREGEQLLPSAKLFYGEFSTYLWEDEVVTSTTSTRERVESKETLSCPCSSSSGNPERSGQSRSDSCQERSCSHWTICDW